MISNVTSQTSPKQLTGICTCTLMKTRADQVHVYNNRITVAKKHIHTHTQTCYTKVSIASIHKLCKYNYRAGNIHVTETDIVFEFIDAYILT